MVSDNLESLVELRRGRGGLALLKDRVATSKDLIREGTMGPLKAPLPWNQRSSTQVQYMIATYQYHSKHRWWRTVHGSMIDKQFFLRSRQDLLRIARDCVREDRVSYLRNGRTDVGQCSLFLWESCSTRWDHILASSPPMLLAPLNG